MEITFQEVHLDRPRVPLIRNYTQHPSGASSFPLYQLPSLQSASAAGAPLCLYPEEEKVLRVFLKDASHTALDLL